MLKMGIEKKGGDPKINRSTRCMILVSSCDAYSDVWDLLFESLLVQWPNRPYPVLLCTESKTYDYKSMGIITLPMNELEKKKEWGGRLKAHLHKMTSEYVLFLLDDFILTDKVNNAQLDVCMTWLDRHQDISVFYFWPINQGKHYIPDSRFPGFAEIGIDSDYRFNCQAAIWRRTDLIECLRDFENPWQWELYGTERSRRLNKRLYAVELDGPKVFSYSNGGIIRRGLFTDEAGVLYEKYNLPMPATRGLWDKNDPYRKAEEYNWREHFPADLLTPRFAKEILRRLFEKARYYRSIF